MILKHRDRELLRFEWTGARGVRDAERKFPPIDMAGKGTDESLWTWISARTVPRGRKYILAILRQLGIPSEFYAAQIAERVELPHVDYGLFSLATYRPDHPQYHEFDDLRKYLNRVEPALYDRWLDYPEKQSTELLAKLTLLEGFRFKRHKHYNLPDDRLIAIENFLARRVSAILDHGKRADDLLRLGNGFVGIKPKKSGIDVDEIRGGSANNSEKSSKPVGIIPANTDSLEYQILANVRADKSITAAEIAEILQVELRTVECKIKLLRESGRLARVGSRKTGYWQVNEGGAE